jgi:FixJ family two-component response regulator
MNDIPTVFVVDDDPEVRESLRLLLMAARIRVETFDSAQAFLEKASPEQCGCLVLDVRMPGMSGVELLEKLAEEHAGLPAIMISASSDQDTKTRAKQAGAVDFLRKPYDTKQLLNRIKQLLETLKQTI